MSERIHLEITVGPEQGRRISLASDGARLGRSSQSDICVQDPSLSRHHCRLYFRPGDGLWISDLASANETIVNDKPISDTRLRVGDTVVVGDTVLKVLDDQPPGAAAADGANAANRPDATKEGHATPVVDLGFDEESTPQRRLHASRTLWITLGAVVSVLIGIAIILRLAGIGGAPNTPEVVRAQEPIERRLILRYEKVEADGDNIFRYDMRLSDDNILAVRIDDLTEGRHLRREQAVDPEQVQALAHEIERSGLLGLDAAYDGIPPPNTLRYWDIEVILDNRAHRTVVQNRVEPEPFRHIRDRLETFGKNELGIWAIQYPRERLIAMAHDSLLLGRKLFAERDVEYGNLAAAIIHFREADLYLETVEPKPDYFAQIVTGLREAQDELNRRYEEQRFRADRALNLSNWETAARELRILLDIIPDRNDERHLEAHRKLLDVENRLRRRGR